MKSQAIHSLQIYSSFILILFLVPLIILSIPVNLFAKVTGECVNCHTMHNSQNGTEVDPNGPNDALLRVTDCLGCHAAADRSTAIDPTTGAPIVLNTAADGPSYGASYGGINQGLAGGNFYWVWTGDDNKGHNVFSNNPDDVLTKAPGQSPGVGGSCVTNSCHDNLHGTVSGSPWPGLEGRQGCTKCHMVQDNKGPIGFHHADDSNTFIETFPWYRFLQGHMAAKDEGVYGIEDSLWQLNLNATVHNEYFGKTPPSSGNKANALPLALNHSMTAFCCGCHGNFHQQVPMGPDTFWIRHPSDAVVPDSGEYAAYTTYNPEAPVARPDLDSYSGPSSDVNLDTDLVMCLSCHRPHGSPYPDLLRWNYEDMGVGGGGSGGCFVCHTEKN